MKPFFRLLYPTLSLLWAAVPLAEAQVPAAPPIQLSGTCSAADAEVAAAVQDAFHRGRAALARGEFLEAVQLLEARLAWINGDPAYLDLLREAYRSCIPRLEHQGQSALAQCYRDRLRILESPSSPPGNRRPSAGDQTPPAGEEARLVVRGRSDDEPPSAPPAPAAPSASPSLVEQADRAFLARRYQEAQTLYARAYEQDRSLPRLCRERWAYCKLHWVTEQLNNQARHPDWLLLETEVRTALSLAPRLEFGQTLLRHIEAAAAPALNGAGRSWPIRHLPELVQGWQVAVSPNFRVFHHDAALAEQVLRVAEQTRAAVLRKWFAEESPADWATPCDIYLHADARAYAHATGTPADSPGHSSIGAERHDASRIHSRRIDLHTDEPHMLRAVLPHETTHVTLAGRFGPKPLPRWADEGIAVLSEPYERIQRHLQPLWQNPDDDRRFTAAELMAQEEYPGAGKMAFFYGQSATLVQFLTEQKGPRAFTDFLREAQSQGYAAALKRHYGLDLPELEQRWQRYVYDDKVPSLNLALRR
jgi:tetratricopeptide (TPR) repeat protein